MQQLSVEGLSKLSVFRMLRLLWLARLVKLMHSCRDLWLLVCGLMSGLKTLFWVAMLMSVAIYMCAIFCVEMVGKDEWPEEDDFDNVKYFGNIFYSMLTLWEC